MDTKTIQVDCVDENMRHRDLLAWATAHVDRLMHNPGGRQEISEMLDWMAHFTREHFGFQERLLAQFGQQRQYLIDRAQAHAQFRRRLAELCLDSVRGDASVPNRLCDLCHEMMLDTESDLDRFTETVRKHAQDMRLRADRRRAELATAALQMFNCDPTDAKH